jgi:hypothetical protein
MRAGNAREDESQRVARRYIYVEVAPAVKAVTHLQRVAEIGAEIPVRLRRQLNHA